MLEIVTYFLPILILSIFVLTLKRLGKNPPKVESLSLNEDKKSAKLLFFIIFAILGFIAIFTILSFRSYTHLKDSENSHYTQKIYQSCYSPDQKMIATFYELSGGGAAGWVSQRVSLRPKEIPFSEAEDIIFQIRHGSQVTMIWENEKVLKIEYPEESEIDKKTELYKDIKIIYEKNKETR